MLRGDFLGQINLLISVIAISHFGNRMTTIIQLSGPKARAVGAEAIIDKEKVELVEGWAWRLHANGYAVRNVKKNGKNATIRMHRVVAGIADNTDLEVDHINGNPLDNRMENLFFGLTKSKAFRSLQSRRCRSYGAVDRRGVRWYEKAGKYRVRMRDINGKARNYGYFHDKEEASRVYEALWTDIVEKLEKIVKEEVAVYRRENAGMAAEDFRV